MVKIVFLVTAIVFFISIVTLISIFSSPQKTSPLNNAINDISFPNGDHMIFYQPAQQVIASAQQLSTIPDFPIKLLGTDSHNDVIAENTTSNQIINATRNSTQANQIIALANSTTQTNGGSYLTVSGESYNPANGATLTNPTVTQQCLTGNICPLSGKILMSDPNTCHVQTVNGVQQNVCSYISGPFRFELQIICVDSNPYRCSFLSGRLPTHGTGMTAETNPDGTWTYNWTVGSDQYFVGSYIARMTVESEIAGKNGLLQSQTGDYPINVLQ